MTHNRTILIADDRPVGRENLESLLQNEGYDLTFACNGQETLEIAIELVPDLILLDVMMPDMDGFEVCRRLRSNPDLAEVPIIMVTALDDRASRLEGIEAGADDFIIKPFDRLELRTRVRTITRLNRYRRLLSERTKFGWVVDRADDGYVIINEHDDILYANPQARLYLGLTNEQAESGQNRFLALAKKQYVCKPQDAWEDWPQQFDKQISHYLVRPASASAPSFWLQVELIDVDTGTEDQYLVRFRDVTAKIAEHRAMWTFHGQISHKLRTPLNHLIASFDVLDEESISEPNIKSFLSIARGGALCLRDEIQDVIQYIEAPSLIGDDQDLCNISAISTITSHVETDLDLAPINISFEAFKDPAYCYVRLPRRVVELIFYELCENAKKFHPQHSPMIEIGIRRDTEGVQIRVGDNGVTLAPDQLARMWTPYYQAERSFTGQMSGTGLGLAMVASLVWEVGGTCRCFNREEGPGVVVEISLPVAETG